MRKLIFLIAISLALFKSNAQVVFCPPGATWTTLFYYSAHGSFSYYTEVIKYIGDSIEGVDTLKKLTHTRFFINNEAPLYGLITTFIRQEGDTVFMRNLFTNNQWQILYNFAALSGHSWTNTVQPPSKSAIEYTTTVTAVNVATLAGKQVAELSVTYANNLGNSHTGLISEYRGSQGFLFNYRRSMHISHAESFIENLCYTDSVIGQQVFSEKGCLYNVSGNFLGLNEKQPTTAVKLYPNPATEVIKIELPDMPDSELSIVMRDIIGRKLYEGKMFSNTKLDVPLKGLANGAYFFSVYKNENLIHQAKVVKIE